MGRAASAPHTDRGCACRVCDTDRAPRTAAARTCSSAELRSVTASVICAAVQLAWRAWARRDNLQAILALLRGKSTVDGTTEGRRRDLGVAWGTSFRWLRSVYARSKPLIPVRRGR